MSLLRARSGFSFVGNDVMAPSVFGAVPLSSDTAHSLSGTLRAKLSAPSVKGAAVVRHGTFVERAIFNLFVVTALLMGFINIRARQILAIRRC